MKNGGLTTEGLSLAEEALSAAELALNCEIIVLKNDCFVNTPLYNSL